jgi:hypothetical protein
MKLNSMSWLTVLWNYAQTRCDLCLKFVCECLMFMPGSNEKLAYINIKNMLFKVRILVGRCTHIWCPTYLVCTLCLIHVQACYELSDPNNLVHSSSRAATYSASAVDWAITFKLGWSFKGDWRLGGILVESRRRFKVPFCGKQNDSSLHDKQ